MLGFAIFHAIEIDSASKKSMMRYCHHLLKKQTKIKVGYGILWI
jgi:hypothetical protein